MHRSAWRPTGSTSVSVRPLSSSTRWNACGPSPGVTPVHIDVYGFIRSAVEERGRSWRNTSRSCQRGDELLDPHHRDQRLGQRQAHPAVALGLDDHHGPGLGDREVRAGDRDLRAQELLPQVEPGGLGERARLVGQVRGRRPAGAGHLALEDLADLAPVAVDRRHEDVRRQVAAELHDELGEVGLPGRDPFLREGLVELDLLGGHRLDLDHLVGAGLADERGRRWRWPPPRRVPSGPSRRAAVTFASSRSRRAGRSREDLVLDRRAGEAERLPVGALLDGARALGRGSSSSRRRFVRSCASARAVRAACGNGGVPAKVGVGGGLPRPEAGAVTPRPPRRGSRPGA